MNERITEQLTRNLLQKTNYYNSPDIIVEEQQTKHKLIKRLLINASKSGNGSGRPEFIIWSKRDRSFCIIIECKADVNKHCSKDKNKPKEFAVDGVLHYAKLISQKMKVIAIAISGQDEKELKISSFLIAAAGKEIYELQANTIITFQKYYNWATVSPEVKQENIRLLMEHSHRLHNYLRDYAKLSESEKPQLVGVILMALSNEYFSDTYRKIEDGTALANQILTALEKELDKSQLPENKGRLVTQSVENLLRNPELIKGNIVDGTCPLFEITNRLSEKVLPILKQNRFDILGYFYQDFLSYTAGDKKSQGIVLTPHHITELFTHLTQVSYTDTVIDTCCGTGGFLISAMNTMISSARGNLEIISKIKKEKLIGIEQMPHMFSLCALNMTIMGDGKSNLYQGDCFQWAKNLKVKPTVGMINPPYAQKGKGLSELDFIECMLDCLEVGGRGAAIIPMSCCISGPREIKERLLKKHTLVAVMTMPYELFYPVGVYTVVTIWHANIPHNPSIPTWFASWKDDGFVKTKNQGRCDYYNRWKDIKKQWTEDFYSCAQKPGKAISQKVGPSDEWLAEAYLKPNYEKLSLGGKITSMFINSAIEKLENSKRKAEQTGEEINISQWKEFTISDLFDIEEGRGPSLRECQDNPGNTPCLTACTTNNGIACYTAFEPKYPGNQITITKDGVNLGTPFYQDNPFIISANVYVLTPKPTLRFYGLRVYPDGLFSPAIAVFLLPLLELNQQKYSYGRKLTLERIKDDVIKLPVDKNGNPNTKWMMDFVKNNIQKSEGYLVKEDDTLKLFFKPSYLLKEEAAENLKSSIQ